MSATTTQLLSSGEICKLRYETIPVKSASANVSFYTNNSKMPNFELWHSCRKWGIHIQINKIYIYIYIYIYILYIFPIGKTSTSRSPKRNNDYFLLGIKLLPNIKECNLTVQCIRIMRLVIYNIGFWIRIDTHKLGTVQHCLHSKTKISGALSTKIWRK